MARPSNGTFSVICQNIDKISRYSNYLASFLLIVMTFILGYEVIARRFFDSPTIWVYPLTGFVFMWFPLLASAYVFKQDAHVRCDIFLPLLSDDTRQLMTIATDIVSLIFVVVLLYSGTLKVIGQYRFEETVMGLISYPKWILYASIPICIALSLTQVICNIVRRCGALKKEALWGTGLFLSNPIVVVSVFFILCSFGVYLFAFSPAASIILLTLLLIVSGVPVAFALGAVGCISMFIMGQGGLSAFNPVPIIAGHTFGSFTLVAIPLFVLGGYILSEGELGQRLYDFVGNWLSFVPGNLGAATVVTGGLLAAMIGSSTAVTAIIAVVAIKPLLDAKYSKNLTYGTVAGTSLGIIIPPSIGFVLYGYLTNTSVGKLFMAGFTPGILLVVLFSVYVIVACMVKGIRPAKKVTWKERFISLRRAIFILLVPASVLGGIYTGVMTPTEASAILVLLSLLGLIIYRKFTWKIIKGCLEKASVASTMILFIMLGAMTVTHVLAFLRIPRGLAEFVMSSQQPVWVIVIALFVMYLILGMFLEGASMVVLTVPVVAPMISGIGIDLISFGVILMLMIEIALLTPPVGLNLFVVKGIINEPLSLIIKGTFPYLLIIMFVAILIYFFPDIALWLPNKMSQ